MNGQNAPAEIKKMTIDDLSFCAEVIRRSFETEALEFGLTRENCPGHTSFITSGRLVEKCVELDKFYPFVCVSGGAIIGYVSLTGVGSGTYVMEHLAIVPEMRRLGHGRLMLGFCKKKAAELGGDVIKIGIIEENARLRDWYLANGFVHTGTKRFAHLPFTVGFMEWRVRDQ